MPRSWQQPAAARFRLKVSRQAGHSTAHVHAEVRARPDALPRPASLRQSQSRHHRPLPRRARPSTTAAEMASSLTPVGNASLQGLPQELFEGICRYLPTSSWTGLARTSKSFHSKLQVLLYKHVVVNSLSKLSLLVRTLSDVAKVNKWGDMVSKDVRSLRISVNLEREEGGLRLTAAVFSRLIESVARLCPRVDTTLVLENAACDGQPMASISKGKFPRVVSFVLYTGKSEEEDILTRASISASASFSQVLPIQRMGLRALDRLDYNAPVGRCRAGAEFWTRVFNGNTFPDLMDFKLVHKKFGGTPPSAPVEFKDGELAGLGKLTTLSVTSAPELTDSVLFGALAQAYSLKRLELKNNVLLSYTSLAKLLAFALPHLEELTLHVQNMSHSAESSRRHVRRYSPVIDKKAPDDHLCTVIREHGRNIHMLDLDLPYVCRDLFITEVEKRKLLDADIKSDIAGDAGEAQLEVVDVDGIRNTITGHRENVLRESIKQAAMESVKQAKTAGRDKAVSEAQREVEQARLTRLRKIQQGRWSRIIVAGTGLCRDHEAWEELCVLAQCEKVRDPGIEWKLGHKALNTASVYRGGSGEDISSMPYDVLFQKDLEGPQQFIQPPPDGHDPNDNAAWG